MSKQEEFEQWMKSDKCPIRSDMLRWDICSIVWHTCAEQNDAKWMACVERKNKVIDEQAAEIAALREAAQDFVDKVERGEARSVRSYRKFKKALTGEASE